MTALVEMIDYECAACASPHRKQKPDRHHHVQADDFGRRLELSEWISHPKTSLNRRNHLK